jgi:uncharacterized membrane protein
VNLGTIQPDSALVWAALVLLLAVLAAALMAAPWRALLARLERQRALGMAIVLLPMLWSMSPGLPGGVQLQLLGMTTVTLVFGWQLAIVSGVIAGLVMLVVGTWVAAAVPVNLVLTVVVPVAVTVLILAAANRLRRTNLFVYLLGVGFGGSILALMASLLVGSWVTDPGLDHAVVLLLAFPEGFLNGALVSALTVFYPELVRTYDDVRYLGKPR